MSSELFSKLQEELRFHKSHGIDLTHPRGVVLNGRVYPAKQKGITIQNKEPSTSKSAFFKIPYETENVANIYHEVLPSGRRLDVSLQNPTTFNSITSLSNYRGYTTKLLNSYGVIKNKNNHNLSHDSVNWNIVPYKDGETDWEHLHQELKNWSSHPAESYETDVSYPESSRDLRPMTNAEKLKHRAYVNEPDYNPNKISVVAYGPTGFSTHFYDVQTEELTPLQLSFKNKHIWGDAV